MSDREFCDLEPQPSIVATACSEIEERQVAWLWKGYIPRSALTLLEGPPKAGKSTVLADLVARVSMGGLMPDKQPTSPGAVLMLSDEDSPAHVIKPRLRVAGALLGAVYIIKARDREKRPRQFQIGSDDMARLEEEIDKTGAVLVVIDPLSIYMGGTDAHREQEVRQTLWHLSELAERTGVSILACRHWKKARTGDALSQGGGSVGFSAAARSILSVERDPDNKSARVLAVGYSNYSADYPSLAFHLEGQSGEDVAKVVWDGVSRHDADALASVRMGGEERGLRAEAEDFLREILLPRGSRVLVNDINKAADAEGITRGTLRRAKRALRVEKGKDGLHGPWSWWLPPEDAQENGINIFDTGARCLSTFEDAQPDHGDAWEGPEVGS